MRTRWIDESLISIRGDKARVVSTGTNEIKATIKKENPRFDSKLEMAYDQYLAALKFAKEIREYWYHPITFHLPGGIRHKPDFVIWPMDSDRLKIHECKGWSKNLRDGMTRLHIAGGIFVCYEWSLVKQVKGQWEITAI